MTQIDFFLHCALYWLLFYVQEPEFEQDNVGDRLGFHHTMLVVGLWPTLFHLAAEIWDGKGPVQRDIQDTLYSKFAYVFTKVMYSG